MQKRRLFYDGISSSKQQKSEQHRFTEDNIDAKGKKCWLLVVEILVQIVIGTANRQGATEVHQIEIMPTRLHKETKQCLANVSYDSENHHFHEEGCTRKWAINAKEFIKKKDEAGKSKKV